MPSLSVQNTLTLAEGQDQRNAMSTTICQDTLPVIEGST
jgi:hypothetical protein